MATTSFETINGHRYEVIRDDEGNILSQLAADIIVPPPVALSKFQFRLLFSLEERVLLDNYETLPITTEQKALLRTLHYDFQIADDILLQHPLTIQGVTLLEQAGIIAPGRAAQILSGQPYSAN